VGPAPSVAAIRLAVRRSLGDLGPGAVLVACSGGADSLALLAAAVFECRAAAGSSDGRPLVAVTVDHGLWSGSADHARAVTAQMGALGAEPSLSLRVEVGMAGGPEAAARRARYDALTRLAAERSAVAVLLGHTRDDQAETVLLGLARGSGARSLSGMAPVSGLYRRPLLDLSRADTERACRDQGVDFWSDPDNARERFARVRVRRRVLPVLEQELGPGISEALARTAGLLRDDADALDALAADAWRAAGGEHGHLVVAALDRCLPAVRRRALRRAALAAGCPAGELFAVHVDTLDALVTDWHGQRWVDLPGRVRARRVEGTLHFASAPVGG
jgi:tRNA(Ile)-lysidine synthase